MLALKLNVGDIINAFDFTKCNFVSVCNSDSTKIILLIYI